MKIVKKQNEIDIMNDWYSDQVYIEELNVNVKRYQGSIEIIELDSALRTGKVCVSHKISWRSGNQSSTPFLNWILNKGMNSVSDILEYCKSQEVSLNQWGGYKDVLVGNQDEVDIYYYRGKEKGVRVFSPFNLKYIKPLKELPGKWKLTHAIKVIVNGQYEGLKKNYYMTDDYAFDAAYNFQKGAINKGLEFIKNIIESPRGWWTSINEHGSVSLCCHTFDSNSFQLKLK